VTLFQTLFPWQRIQRFRTGNSKYLPHQGAREMARRRGELGWRARDGVTQ